MFCHSLIRNTGKSALRAKASAAAASSSRTLGRVVFSSASVSPSVPAWATVDPGCMGVDAEPYAVQNLVGGNWEGSTSKTITVPHPLDETAPPIFTIPDTQVSELDPFLESMRKVSKSGLHNPLKNPERYVQYGEISRKVRTMNVQKNYRYLLKKR